MGRQQSAVDYGADGIDIQTAMVRHVKAHPDATTRTKFIMWNGVRLWISYELRVPESGRVRFQFVSQPRDCLQGVDLKPEGGAVQLVRGELIQTLRTWNDPRHEHIVEYPYTSEKRLLRVWNVYQRQWPDGRVTEEKWTGNAGMVVEDRGAAGWLFRCGDGPSDPPDFEQLVFRLAVLTTE